MSIQRYAVIETALCIGGKVLDGEVAMVMAADHHLEVEKIRKELKIWENFAGYLLDHCEGETIYEESLQHWLSESIKLYKKPESESAE